MSTIPNAYGNFLSNATPFMAAAPAIGFPWGTLIKPGGRVAAYVRSTGAQDGDDHFAASGMLVTSINEGCKRCREDMNDIVYVLPGHTETISTASASLFNDLASGAQIIGVGSPGAFNAPTINLSHATATIALNQANVTLCGLNIRSATAALTQAIVISAGGCTLASCSIICTGALGANSVIQVQGAANTAIVNNYIVVDSTATMIAITAAQSTNFLVQGNVARQTQATTGGSFSTTANTAGISGIYANNLYKTATTGTAGAGVIVIGAAGLTTVGNFENYGCDETAAGALLVTGA